MKIRRSRSVVDWFKFEKINPLKQEPVETTLKTDVVLLNNDVRDQQTVNTIGVQLTFSLVLKRFVITGKVSQISYIVEKEINSEADFSEKEMHELLAPLFDMIHRMTYEITEIALDEPGTSLDFSPIKKEIGKREKSET
ncbi:DUF1149 family protein [Enterococcus alishanensis]